MKSCPQAEIWQAYLDGELAAEAGAAVRVHLTDCSRCAEAVREMQQALTAMNQALTTTWPDVVPTARLRARIASALAEQTAPKAAWAQWPGPFGWAATVLLLAGIAGWIWRATPPLQPPQPAHDEKPALALLPKPPATFSPVSARPPLRPRHPVRQRTRGDHAEKAEVVTQFFPLREGEDLAAAETMRLVRVELPGSALAEVGWPMPLEAAQTPVKADVLLGEDGLARAIRFVR